MAIVGVELETLVSEPDALTTRPPPCAIIRYLVRTFFGTAHTLSIEKLFLHCYY